MASLASLGVKSLNHQARAPGRSDLNRTCQRVLLEFKHFSNQPSIEILRWDVVEHMLLTPSLASLRSKDAEDEAVVAAKQQLS